MVSFDFLLESIGSFWCVELLELFGSWQIGVWILVY